MSNVEQEQDSGSALLDGKKAEASEQREEKLKAQYSSVT